MIELVNTTGIFALDGGEWEVTNNIWLVGNDREVIVIDAAHDAAPIVDAISGRHVRAIALTHGHNDHINAALALQDVVDAPILLHPDDLMLWHVVYPDVEPDKPLADGQVLKAGGAELGVLHTPGHAPGCCCFHIVSGAADGTDVLFSGDTLFCGGPGATIAPADVIAWSRENMANYKVPRYVEVVESLPMNASGKILKVDLRARESG